MALVAEFICAHCRKPKHELVVRSHICAACRVAIDKADTEAHMAKRAVLPIEERVRQIELALYKLDADGRFKALEAENTRY